MKDLVTFIAQALVETPDEGAYKGVKRLVKTKERKINVKPVPPGYSRSEWLVASGMLVKESWSGDKTEVKGGDVLERSISREVSGTVSELIPPINWESLPGVSLYPARSEVNNHKTRTAISASRRDGIRYLFEKEGEGIKEYDFFDAPQIFCCDNRLGLGIGNVERNYPLFGNPTLRFCS